MANPRQRRKAKSATHKAISHSKRAKQLLKKMPGKHPGKATPGVISAVRKEAEQLSHCSNPRTEGFARRMGPI